VVNGFKRRKEQKKASIQKAALELFSRYGFDKVSISDISHQAHVSHVTIYNHFGSKDELILDTVKASISALTEKARAIIDSNMPFLEKLEHIILGEAEFASQYQGQLIQMTAHNSPEIEQFMQSLWQHEVNKMVIDLAEEGKKLGYIRKNLSQKVLLYYFEIIRRGIMASSDLLAEIKMDAEFVQELDMLLFFGLVSKKK